MVDVNASFSGSSSASSAQDQRGAFSNVFGDTLTGGSKKPTPDWLKAIIIGAVAAVALVFFLRR